MKKSLLLEAVSPFHFRDLLQKGVSMDVLYLLVLADSGYVMDNPNAKEKALIASLKRKFLVDKDFRITQEGKVFIDFLEQDESLQIVKKIERDEAFEKWWASYPSTDQWEYQGKVYKGERGLKVKKEDCRLKFQEIINEGDHTVNDLINALQYEVVMKRKKSIELGINRMSFMQQTITYLNQRTFESFIDLAKQGVPDLAERPASRSSVVDI